MEFIAQTERFRLRPLKPSDCEPMRRLLSNWSITSGVLVPQHYTLEQARALYDKMKDKRQENMPEYLVIAARDNDAPLGGVHMQTPEAKPFGPPPKRGEKEIGYWVGTDHRRQGIATEAVWAFVTAAFRLTHIVLVSATTQLNNPKSEGVLRRCGFRDCGLISYSPLPNGPKVKSWEKKRADHTVIL